jgi:hypothetical protein
MNYWICRKCKSENTPTSNICWKCSATRHSNEGSSSNKRDSNFYREKNSTFEEKGKDSAKDSNYWTCHKCKEQIFYLTQFCPVCFTQRPEKITTSSNKENGTVRNERSESSKLICICSSCGLKIRILYVPGKHEMQCPNCHQEFEVFIMSDRSVHLVKKVTVFENIKRKLQWYEVLEIKPDSSYEEIKAAYRKLMKEYHPDKVATLGKELKALAESKTKEISEAYETAIKTKNEFK